MWSFANTQFPTIFTKYVKAHKTSVKIANVKKKKREKNSSRKRTNILELKRLSFLFMEWMEHMQMLNG